MFPGSHKNQMRCFRFTLVLLPHPVQQKQSQESSAQGVHLDCLLPTVTHEKNS